MWSVISMTAPGRKLLAQAAGGVGQDQVADAERLQRLERCAHRVGAAVLVVVRAAGNDGDGPPAIAPTTSAPAWPETDGVGKASSSP